MKNHIFKALVQCMFISSLLLSNNSMAQQTESHITCDEGAITEPIDINSGNSTQGCKIDAASDRDRFTFVGAIDAEIRIEILSQTNFLDPKLEIRDPEGEVILAQECSGQDVFGNGIRCSFEANLILPVNGNYDLAMSDSGSNEVGSYLLQIETIPPEFLPAVVPYDLTTTDTISPGTDNDFFRFYGLPNTQVRVNMLSRTNFYDPRLEIRAPDNSIILNDTCNGQDVFGNGIRCSFSATITPELEGH